MIRHVLCASALAVALSATPALAADPIRIGAVMPFSGPGASWGISLAGVTEILAEEINAAGGLEVNGEKHLVEVLRYDDKYATNEAVSAMSRLVFQDSVKFVLTLTSPSTLAIAPMSKENEVLVITQGFATQLLAEDAPYTFRVTIPSSAFALPQINWVGQRLGVKKVGGLFPNDDGGQQIAKDVAAAYEANGMSLQPEFFEQGRVDFVPLITRLISAGSEAIELDGNSPATAGQIVKQAREIGFKGPIIRTGGESTADIINVAGAEAAEGLYVHMPADLSAAEPAALRQTFEAKFGMPLSATAVPEYAGIQLLFAAIQKAGSVDDVPATAQALKSLQGHATVLGSINWVGEIKANGTVYANGQQMMYPFYVGQVEKGQVRVVATCNETTCQ